MKINANYFAEYSVALDRIRHLKHSIELLDIPQDWFIELEMFAQRNVVRTDTTPRVCSNCFKAYAINKALEIGLPSEIVQSISKKIPGERGHGDYYLDNKEVHLLQL